MGPGHPGKITEVGAHRTPGFQELSNRHRIDRERIGRMGAKTLQPQQSTMSADSAKLDSFSGCRAHAAPTSHL